ncbi:MAG: hypothetical protein B7Z20_07235, partial [Sphingobium sp. 32-64-5]
MFDRIDAFVRDVSTIETEIALAERLDEICREMGFAYFALTHHVDIRHTPGPAIRLANYPSDWVDYFDAHKLGPSDPVHRASHLTSVGFAWSKLSRLIALTPRDLQVLELAGRVADFLELAELMCVDALDRALVTLLAERQVDPEEL